ncbi:MAG: sigma 54-interacting transcriptional regulator [Deltaproteobacteria bacterium]|nr:sigma 54-interacting transcriptional regulator [Deltaproteobacteria bacterium]
MSFIPDTVSESQPSFLMAIQTLTLINQISRVLNSSGDLMRNLNMILIMLKEYLPIRNPCLLINDQVVKRYFIDLAPEISEEAKNLWNRNVSEGLPTSPLKYAQEMVLYPEEPDLLRLPCDVDVQQTHTARVIKPLIFQRQGLPLGILSVMVMSTSLLDPVSKIIRSVSDMIAVTMIARGFPASKIYDSAQEPDGAPRILDDIVGSSEPMKKLADTIRKVSSSKASVMIYGESGTGKELLAKAIHNNGFHRKAPFVGVNCAALTDNLLESELFGHEKGSFTGALAARKGRFELADGGTLFLDEIGDTTLNFQTKILRVLQEGEFEKLGGSQTMHVDVRIVCATNLNLEKAVAENRFREDLYYRLNVIKLEVPPLRDRREDILFLVAYFLEKLNQQDQKSVSIRPADLDYLCGLRWSGNVRELENAVHSAFLMEQDNYLNFKETFKSPIPVSPRKNRSTFELFPEKPAQSPFTKSSLEEEEQVAIEQALSNTGGIQVKTAELLGISVRQLRYRIKKYRIAVRKISIHNR